MEIITLTKRAQDIGAAVPGTPLPYGDMVLGIVGDRGVAIYPGQSAEEVLEIAAVIQRELGWMPRNDFTSGLALTVDWYQNYFAHERERQ